MHIFAPTFPPKKQPHERQFSWHVSNIFYVTNDCKINPVGCLKPTQNFAKCGFATMVLERAHTRPKSRWVNVFAKLKKKNYSDESNKKICAIRIPNRHVKAKVAANNKSSNG